MRELGQHIAGLSKVRNSCRIRRENHQLIFVGCRRDSQSRKQNRFRKCAPQSSHRLATVWGPNCGATKNCSCRSRVLLVVQKQWKTNRFRRFWPARNRCASGLGRDVFFRGRSRERSVLSFLVLSLQNRSAPFLRKKQGGVKETNNDVVRPEPKRLFLHTCTDGKAETVARIELKPARAKIAAANCIKVRKLCMYVMI